MPNHYLPPEGQLMLMASMIQEVHEPISGLRMLRLLRRLLKLVGCRGVRRWFRALYVRGFVRASCAVEASAPVSNRCCCFPDGH